MEYVKSADKIFWLERENKAAYVALLKEKYNLPYKEISELASESKREVYSLYRYGARRLTKATILKVRIRDDNKCTSCGAKNRLHTHHKGNPKNHTMRNLVTLCPKCHKAAHSKSI